MRDVLFVVDLVLMIVIIVMRRLLTHRGILISLRLVSVVAAR